MPAYRKSILLRLNGLVLIAVLPALAVILYHSWLHHRTVMENSRSGMLRLAQAVAFQHEGQAQGLNLLLTTLARLPDVRDGKAAGGERIFEASIRNNPFLRNIFLVAPDGRVICSATPLPSGYSAEGKKYFREAVATGRFSVGEYEPGHDRWYPPLNFCLPILSGGETGRVTGLLVASLDLDAFSEICRRMKLPPGGVFNLSDSRGILLYRFPRHETIIPGTPDRPELRRQVTGPDEEGSFFGIGRDGIRRLLAFKRLRNAPDAAPYLYLRLTIPEQGIRETILRGRWTSLLLLALSTLGALSASWVLGDFIIGRRLKQLVVAAKRLGKGELSITSGIPHDGDEIGQVAASFDEMAKRLEEQAAEKREAIEELHSILQTALDGFVVVDREGRIREVNEAACTLFGHDRDALLSMHLSDLEAEHSREALARHLELLREQGGGRFEARNRRKDGSLIDLDISIRFLETSGGKYIAFLRDITGRKRAEEERARLQLQMQNAQKLEGLGVLAGGIAHDFNNLLTVIIGNVDAVLSSGEIASPATRKRLEDTDRAALRAADLSHQMLAYSGMGPFTPERIDLGAIVSEMAPLLEMSISRKAQFCISSPADPVIVSADPGQIRQVVMNLVVNASEALGGLEGEIVVSTRTRAMDRDSLANAHLGNDFPEGAYACIEVRDTGCGMSPETQSRIFDPFYTTKFTGRGLGLAAVLGIVRAHQGGISVDSRPGEGSTFTIYLPPAKSVSPPSPPVAERKQWIGTGSVLLVDDEPLVRNVAAEMLGMLGYDVIEAGDGIEALERFHERRNDIALVILDLTMPRMDGREALKALRGIDPGLRVLVASGYSQEGCGGWFSGEDGVGFIAKPFRLAELSSRIAELLGPSGGSARVPD
jgi:PAS domain S-box-containing protein